MKHFLLFISLCAICISYGQEQIITGVVTAENNKIQGATVSVKNSFNETVTDKDGKFSLKVSDDDNVLEVFYFGLEYKEVSINRGQIMNIYLQRDAELLEEVLLVGKVKENEELVETAYGKQNKKALGYSVGQELTEDDILPSDVNTFELLRKMPGV